MIIKPFFIAPDGTLTHTRGDTAELSLTVYVDGLKRETFSATLSVKQYPDDDAYLYQVHFDQDTPCVITHDMTKNIPYGTYWYDVQVMYWKGTSREYKTIGAFPYILKPDVTG